MKRFGEPQVIVTDRLRSYGAALKELGLQDRQETGRWLNNRIENSHLQLRRERAMQRFRRMTSLQTFATIHSSVFNHFNHDRHLNRREIFKQSWTVALGDGVNSAPRKVPRALPSQRPFRIRLTAPLLLVTETERTARPTCRTRDEARANVFDYIERFYDPKRRHSPNRYLSTK